MALTESLLKSDIAHFKNTLFGQFSNPLLNFKGGAMLPLRTILVVILFTAMFLSTVMGQSGLISNTTASSAPGGETYIAVDPSNPLHLMMVDQGTTGRDVSYAFSTDGGTSWINQGVLIPPGFTHAFEPACACSP